MASLRRTIEEARFFDLPDDLGPAAIDGDEHVMQIRMGKQSRRVELDEWPENWSDASYLSREQLGHTRRAVAVWSAIRALVTEPEAKVP